jgi:hypothetical protein
MTFFDIIAQWGVFAMVVVTLILRRQLTLFHPTTFYLVFHAIVFCVRPTLVWALDFDSVFLYMQFHPSPEVMRSTLMVSSFALVVFCGTFSLVCTSTVVGETGENPVITPGMRKAFWAMALLVAPLGFYSVIAQNITGVHVRGVYVLTESSGYINELQQVFVSLVVLFAFVTRWRWFSFIPLLIFIYYRAGQGHARWMMIYPVFFLVLLYLWERRRRLPPLRILLPIPLLFFLFINMTHDRWFVHRWIQGDEFVAPLVENETMTFKDRYDTMDFANFDFLAFVIDTVPEKTRGYNYGAQHLQIFTEPIPRALWRGKPVGAPVTLVDWNRFGNTLGITTSVVGDGWISYGWLGVMVNMLLYGTALALLYNWFVIHQGHIFRGLIALLIFSILVQVFRDGSFVTIAKFLLFTMFPILLWWVIHTVLFPDEIEELDEVKTP